MKRSIAILSTIVLLAPTIARSQTGLLKSQGNSSAPKVSSARVVTIAPYRPGLQAVLVDGTPVIIAPERMLIRAEVIPPDVPELQQVSEAKYGIQLWNARAYYGRIEVKNEGGGPVTHVDPGQECPLYSNGVLVFPQGDSITFPCDLLETPSWRDVATLLMRRFYLENVDPANTCQSIRSVVQSFGEPRGSYLCTVTYGTILPTKWMVITSHYLDQRGATVENPPCPNTICALGLYDDMICPPNPLFNDELSITMSCLTREWDYVDRTNNKRKYEGVSIGIFQVDSLGYLHSIRPCIVVEGVANPVNVTLESEPSGLLLSVDGLQCQTPRTFAWQPGSHHVLNSGLIQPSGQDTQYSFVNWSDSGQSSHTIVVPDSDIVYRATYVRTTSLGASCSLTPTMFALEQNYPNPFNPSTVIRYTVGWAGNQGPGISKIRLVVYDLLGREVAVLVDEKKAPGNYEVTFDASDLVSGVYICRMTTGSFTQSRKILLLK